MKAKERMEEERDTSLHCIPLQTGVRQESEEAQLLQCGGCYVCVLVIGSAEL